MNKRLLAIITMLPVLLTVSIMPVYSDQHKKEEVSSLIAEVQSRLNTIRNGVSADIVKSESSRIDQSCNLSQRLLSEGKIDEAYDEIMLCNLCFRMIDARVDLQKALWELDETKKNLSR